LMAPPQLLARIDTWRRAQSVIPSLSEGIRKLIEMGLDAAEKAAEAEKNGEKPGKGKRGG